MSDRPQWIFWYNDPDDADKDVVSIIARHYSAEAARVQELREAAQAVAEGVGTQAENANAWKRLNVALKAWEK